MIPFSVIAIIIIIYFCECWTAADVQSRARPSSRARASGQDPGVCRDARFKLLLLLLLLLITIIMIIIMIMII